MNVQEHLIRYLLAFGLPLLATMFATPIAARIAHRFGILDHPRDSRHHANPTPYLGGLAVAAGLLVFGAFATSASGQVLVILGGGLMMMLIGLIDDRRTLRPGVKILAEVVAASALWAAGVRGGMFGNPLLDYALTVFWVLAITNALNLLDNMDGLAAGVTAIASTTYFIIAASNGDYLVASFALALAGASLGFLRHNFPPARIFLGDAGSLMLGFLLSALALKLDLVGESGWTHIVVPILILGVPIFDTTLVIIARIAEHRPISVGGTDHSSHRLTELGLSGRSVALATYAAQIVTCGVALILVFTGGAASPLVLALVFLAGLVVLLRFLSMEHRRHPDPTANEG